MYNLKLRKIDKIFPLVYIQRKNELEGRTHGLTTRIQKEKYESVRDHTILIQFLSGWDKHCHVNNPGSYPDSCKSFVCVRMKESVWPSRIQNSFGEEGVCM